MIQMYNRDCMELMKEYPDGYFELAIVDPPYGIGVAGYSTSPKTIFGKKAKNAGSKFVKKAWDVKPNQPYFKEITRVSKNQIIWGGNYFTDSLYPSKGWVYWKKNTNGLFADGELAWTSFDTPLKEFEFTWNGLLQQNMANKETRIHPTQKPVALYKWLLTNYAKPGDKILDTHGGSGSICIACHDLGFDLTWTELDPDYYAAAVKRYQQHAAQLQMF